LLLYGLKCRKNFDCFLLLAWPCSFFFVCLDIFSEFFSIVLDEKLKVHLRIMEIHV